MLKSSDYKAYSKFIESLAKKLTKFYYLKLNRSFKISNSLKEKVMIQLQVLIKHLKNLLEKKLKINFQITKLLVKNLNIKNLKVILPGF